MSVIMIVRINTYISSPNREYYQYLINVEGFRLLQGIIKSARPKQNKPCEQPALWILLVGAFANRAD